MDQSAIIFIVLAGAVFLLTGILATHSGGSLNGIKARTVGDGQHGTARWATSKELKKLISMFPSGLLNGGRERISLKPRAWFWAAREKRTPSPPWWTATTSTA